MEPSVKDKHIILGFVGFAILLISSIATLVVAEKFQKFRKTSPKMHMSL